MASSIGIAAASRIIRTSSLPAQCTHTHAHKYQIGGCVVSSGYFAIKAERSGVTANDHEIHSSYHMLAAPMLCRNSSHAMRQMPATTITRPNGRPDRFNLLCAIGD